MKSRRRALAIFFLSATVGLQAFAESDCQSKLDKASQTELGLTVDKFDQGQDAGWRVLAKAGCNAEAAILIERYLVGYESNLRTLKWHQAQLLAVTNQYGPAIVAAEQSVNPDIAPKNCSS